MTETKTYCDHCGKELNDMHDCCDIEIDFSCHWFKTDLCKDCFEKLFAIAENFCERSDNNAE